MNEQFRFKPIPEVHVREVRGHVSPRSGPMVIREAVAHWPIARMLGEADTDREVGRTLGKLLGRRRRLPYTKIDAAADGIIGWKPDYSGLNYNPAGGFGSVPELVERYVDTGQQFYMQGVPMLLAGPIKRRTERLAFLRGWEVDTRFWVGAGKLRIPLHVDPYDNCMCVLNGKKHVRLFPPGVVSELYPIPLRADLRSGLVQNAAVSAFEPDFETFPRAREVLDAGLETVLGPGDALVFPIFWWHSVESSGINVMVNSWYVDDFDVVAQGSVPRNLLHALAAEGAALPRPDACVAAYRALVLSGDASGARAEGVDPRHFARTAGLVARLDADSRAHLWGFYEAWVFQLHGDPFPPLPKEARAMAQRAQRWAKTFNAKMPLAAADFLWRFQRIGRRSLVPSL